MDKVKKVKKVKSKAKRIFISPLRNDIIIAWHNFNINFQTLAKLNLIRLFPQRAIEYIVMGIHSSVFNACSVEKIYGIERTANRQNIAEPSHT